MDQGLRELGRLPVREEARPSERGSASRSTGSSWTDAAASGAGRPKWCSAATPRRDRVEIAEPGSGPATVVARRDRREALVTRDRRAARHLPPRPPGHLARGEVARRSRQGAQHQTQHTHRPAASAEWSSSAHGLTRTSSDTDIETTPHVQRAPMKKKAPSKTAKAAKPAPKAKPAAEARRSRRALRRPPAKGKAAKASPSTPRRRTTSPTRSSRASRRATASRGS